jgi:hypothetical protein
MKAWPFIGFGEQLVKKKQAKQQLANKRDVESVFISSL